MAEPCEPTTLTPEPAPLNTVDSFSEHELQLEQQAVRKLDYTVLPIVALFCLASLLDRTNIGKENIR